MDGFLHRRAELCCVSDALDSMTVSMDGLARPFSLSFSSSLSLQYLPSLPLILPYHGPRPLVHFQFLVLVSFSFSLVFTFTPKLLPVVWVRSRSLVVSFLLFAWTWHSFRRTPVFPLSNICRYITTKE